ncbi:DUF6603 domain-containing protein [Kitasatospora sp. NPDC058162]|uniref:DUF6603 domain-containing protein n=1 Tax=Kitasatospora sp. NPDC058162 TaxID=3346362 RepID=UPI0036D8A2D7
MSLESISERLDEAVSSGGPFIVGAQEVGEPFALLWDFVGGSDKVVLTTPQRPPGSAGEVRATGSVELAGAQQAGASVTFTGDPVVQTVQLELGLADWQFHDCEVSWDLRALRDHLGEAAKQARLTAVITAAVDASAVSRVLLHLPGPGGRDIPFEVSVDSDGTCRLSSVLGPEGIAVSSLTDLEFLPGLGGGVPELPDGIPAPDDLRLYGASFAVDSSGVLQSVAAQVLLLREWNVLGGDLPLALRDVRQDFALLLLGSGQDVPVVTGLSATVVLGEVELTATVSLPDLALELVASLPLGSRTTDILPAGVAAQLADLGLPVEQGDTELLVTARGSLHTREWSLTCGLEGDLPMGPLTLHDLYVTASHSRADALLLAVHAAASVGGVGFAVSVERSDHWVATGAVDNLSLTVVARWVADAFQVEVPVIPEVTLEALAVTYDFTSRDFTFVCDSWLQSGDISAELHFAADRRGAGGGSLLRATLAVDNLAAEPGTVPVWFDAEWESQPGGARISAGWQASTEPDSPGLGVDTLLVGLGFEDAADLLAELPRALCPSLRSVSFRYDGAGRSTVVAAEFGKGVVVFASVPDPSPAGPSVSLLQVAVNVQVGLTDLPLLTGVVPASADLRLSRVGVVYASRDASATVVERLNALVAATRPSLPSFPQAPAGPGSQGGLRRGTVLVVGYELPGSAPASLMVPLSSAGGSGQTGSPTLPQTRWGTGGPLEARALPGPWKAPEGANPPAAEQGPVPSPRSDAVVDSAPGVTGAGDGVVEGVVWPAGRPMPGPQSPVPAVAGGVPVARAGSGGSGAWLDVGRSFGPLHVSRIGLAYERGTVWLMVDGALTGAGLTLSVAGLGLGIDLSGTDSFPVRTRLQGMGVSFERPPLHVSGALVSRPTDEWPVLVQGALTVELTPKLSVLAVGAYQKRRDGAVSLFVFGRAAVPFGGPPPFVVTGFALGFGYQSSVRIPEQDEIGSFPLVRGLDGGLPADPLEVLAELTGGGDPWVRPAEGQIWLTGGLDFTSFEFVRSRVLLLLEAGRDLTLALIGTSEARFPKSGRAYAQVRVELRVVYRSARGELAATAMLVNSYVIDEACALTGGFAFFLWFGPSQYAGDFVLTVGGYHPDYAPHLPAHYPRVPRLGFTWSISGTVTISGGCYFALTPRAIMAGGALDVRYKSGNTEAWLTAWLDVWIQWSPVYFTASIGVRIGAKTKLLFWIRAEIGAEVRLWGPPTGGEVTLRFVFLKITIRFGKSRALPPALDWGRFAAELLPAQVPLQVLAVEGLLAETDLDPAVRRAPQAEPWRVDPAGFAFRVTAVVPVTDVTWADRPVTGGPTDPAGPLHIRPMDRREVVSRLDVTVAYTLDARRPGALWGQAPGIERWTARLERGRVPFSLWGAPDPKATGELLDHGTGLEVHVPAPQTEGQAYTPIAEADLDLEDLVPPALNLPLDPAAGPTGPSPVAPPASGAGVGAVARGIAAPTQVAARAGLHHALRDLLAPSAPIDDPFALADDDLAAYAAHVADIGLDADPLLVPSA